MSFSHTPNAATWIPGWSATILHHFTLSVSLDEKITWMEAFTSTLSWILERRLTSETVDSLMLTASTRTLRHAEEHLKRCSTMRSRTETLWLADSIPYSEMKYRQLTLSGIELQMQRLLTSFGTLFESWHRERFCATISPSERMQSGIIDPRLLCTNTHVSFDSALTDCRSLTNGYVSLCLEQVCLTPPGLHGPHPAAREPKRPRALTALWCAGSHPVLRPPAVKRYANTFDRRTS